MLHFLLIKIGSGFVTLGMLFGSQAAVQPSFGAVNPVGSTNFTLSGAGITSTQNTIPLTSFTTPDGRKLTMSMFGTIGYGALEPQTTAKLEDVTFSGITQNANGTATLTGVTRGNDFVTPYAASTTLAHSHSGGATFILTNTAGFYTQFASVNNTNTYSGLNTFSSTTPPRYDQPGAQAGGTYIATTSEFASVAYVNAVSFSGTTNATAGVKGIVQLATAAQQASSTALGSTGASLVATAANATDTPQAKCNSLGSAAGAGCSVIALLTGKISQVWLDLTASWSFSGAVSIAASSIANLTLNTVAYVFPSSQGAANTVLKNNGSGTLSWGAPPRFVYATTTAISFTSSGTATAYATSTALAFPSGTISASSTVEVSLQVLCTWSASGTLATTAELRDQTGATLATTPDICSSTGASGSHQGWYTFKLTPSAQKYVGMGTNNYANYENDSSGSLPSTMTTTTSLVVVLKGVPSASNLISTLTWVTMTVNP